MRKSMYISSSIFLLCATALFASEAFTPTAYGVKSLGMGGVSIATPQGAQSGFENPALLSYLENSEISVGVSGTSHSRKDSDDTDPFYYNPDNTYAPFMALSYKINDKFDIGFTTSRYRMQSDVIDVLANDIKKIRATIPLSYKFDNLSLGVTFVAEKEKYKLSDFQLSSYQSFSSTDYGYMLGIAYKFPQKGLILAANYKSKINHDFFNVDHYFHLSSASELGVGLHWKISNTNSSIGIDYKRVYSSEIYAKYDPVPWYKDQDVFAIGYSYDVEKWSLRAGYRYVSPLYGYDILSFCYPYESKSHYSIGGTYRFNKQFSADIAVEYAPYSDNLSTGSELTADETSVALSLNYSF